MKKYLYVITNISMPGICKVGITNDVEKRLRDLNKTSMPTRFQLYEEFEPKNTDILEQKILQHFAKERINRKREFLKVHPERVCDYIMDHKNAVPEKESEMRGKFAGLGLKEGNLLIFKEGNDIYYDIRAKIGKGNAIYHNGVKTSLSKSAKKILKERFGKEWKAVQGTLYWTHEGKTIREMMDENDMG